MQRKWANLEAWFMSEVAEDVRTALAEQIGNFPTCTTRGISRWEDRTPSKTASGSVAVATKPLTEQEKTRLIVIRREVGRGYALTIKDIQFLVELTDRAGY